MQSLLSNERYLKFHIYVPKCDAPYHYSFDPSASMDSESDRESDAYSGTASDISSRTSVSSDNIDYSMRSLSQASVMSIESTMQLYKQEYGRELNNYSDVYGLPADDEELDRLELQHQVLIKIFGEKYSPSMTEVLKEEESPAEEKACLDLGCGTGSWISEVAHDFPHIKAVAIDLIPLQAIEIPNLRSEVDDINIGLEHYFGDFNVVHARLIAAGIRDYHCMIDQIAQVLRPGGLVDLSEFDFHIYDIHHQRILFNSEDDIRSPWWGRWMQFLRDAVKAKGGDVDAATNLYDWVLQNPLFEEVTYREYWLPIVSGPYHECNSPDRMVEEAMKNNVITFLGSGRPLLLGQGISETIVTLLEQKAVGEIEERKIPQFTRLQRVTARKKIFTKQ
ncbi:hypothetical protein CPB83DRAFT_808648 [Crepidotus variabilis]|uniref:S-adenosyl-L-methionine-dependent methyltransferase n=1 Tax=Crepidotus variabilis TaxID=179855 RepID=A0A9P6EMQ8_9AGAR|nr:hypothetical protein CPB83DRAFT_808648 [Crepidotus variabilis]